ncbi:MAG: DNA-binding transcriptional LysR family regulator [Oceanicoccus sp.]|jgi:DNA-binding transcriptional LysR family regulator
MRYTLRQLEVFLATAYFQNVTKAADSLAMSQSAASGALKDLEQQFDVLLFDRVGKRLQANELGRLLRPKAEALLEQARDLESQLSKHKDVGRLKIGATLTIGNYLAVGLIAQFIKQTPNARVSLEVANTASIAKQVINFELDIGLIEGEIHHPDLDVSHWRNDDLVVFCSSNHRWAKKQQLTDENLLSAEWILREQGSGTRQGFDRAMHGLISHQNITLELQHTEAIIRAVEADMGISCLSRIALEDSFLRGSLVPLPVPHRDLSRAFYFILRKDKYRSEGIKKWLELCCG